MATLDLSFVDKLPLAFQAAAGIVFGACLFAWVWPRFRDKAASPPAGDRIVLEAASIANMAPVQEIAKNLARLADAAEAIAKAAISREERATDREEEEHQKEERTRLQELEELRRFKSDIERDVPSKTPRKPPYRRS